MNCSFCAPSSDFRYPPCKEVLRSADANQISLKPSVRVDNVAKKDIVPISSQEAGKPVISSILMPGCPQGSIIGKKQLGERGRKLECIRTLLIDNYDSYTYNIYQELSVVNGLPPVVVQNDELAWEDVYRYVYEEKAFDNIVISPGPGSPKCPADVGICIQLLRECRDIPILGVCLGHQALGYAHGAEIVHAPEPVHGRLSEIEHNGCELFHGIPSGPNSGYKVVRYHSLVLDEESLPNEVIPIAWTTSTDAVSFLGDNLDTNGYDRPQKGKVLMGIMHSCRPHYGVQFHPESVATCHGRQMFENFRMITENYWQRLKPSLANQRCSPYAACTLMPYADGLLREVPGSEQLVSYFDDEEYKEASISGQSVVDADNKSCFGMFNTGNLVRPNIGVKYLRLKWKKFDGLANKLGGAKNIFQDLYGHHEAENTFWLDSSSTEKERARFSFMGGKGGFLWRHVTYRLSDQSDTTSGGGGYLTTEDSIGSTTTTFLEDGFFDFLKKDLLQFSYDEKDSEGLPFDFHGGYIGYIGYNLKVECGTVSNRHISRTPDACFFFADNLIAVDHNNGDVYLLSVHEGNTNPLWMEATAEKLLNSEIPSSTERKESRSRASRSLSSKMGFSCDKSRQGYVEDVEKCLEYIRDGESYELCLTTQLRKRTGDVDPLGLYLHLREINPAPYAAWLNFSREKLSICCSSPERFLRLDKNGLLEAKPIKGTIARGSTVAEDELKKRHLQYSEKDQAENLMIVDLLRNDLGRVCEPGSVHVSRLMEVESYATVHTMVSTIQGKKREDVNAVECVRAAFPGGSMTGAPKLRSMELLDAVESGARGVYSGCIGFLSYNQTFDLNIVIRTVVIHDGEASIGAGGAIVALSSPQEEYEEMILKTRAPVKAAAAFL